MGMGMESVPGAVQGRRGEDRGRYRVKEERKYVERELVRMVDKDG